MPLLCRKVHFTPHHWRTKLDIPLRLDGVYKRYIIHGIRNVITSPHCVSSAWDLLTNQEINIERLALAFPDHFGHFLDNQAIANRLEIEGIVLEQLARSSHAQCSALNWKPALYSCCMPAYQMYHRCRVVENFLERNLSRICGLRPSAKVFSTKLGVCYTQL